MNSIVSDSAPARLAAKLGGCLTGPISDAEIDHMAHRMNVVGLAAGGGGVRLLTLLLDPMLDLSVLASRIAAEPGLSIRVLRVANSPFYGHPAGVADLSRATQILGLTALRGIAAAACFDGLTRPVALGSGLDLAAFRDHSLATACAAQMLAERHAPCLAPQAFMAGILHDLGLLVHWRLRPDTAGDVDADQAFARAPAVCGSAHARYGQRLLAAWNLPGSLLQAVAQHDAWAAADTDALRAHEGHLALSGLSGMWGVSDLPGLLALSDRLASAATFTAPGDLPTPPLPTQGPLADVCADLLQRLPSRLQQLTGA